MIFTGSRYEFDPLFRAPISTSNATRRLSVMHLPPPSQVLQYKEIEWVQGMRIDHLAYTEYGNPSKWWIIADANPDILDVNNIAPGTLVRVPQ